MRKASTALLKQGTQTPSPAPDLIPAETKIQPRAYIRIGTVNGGTSERTHWQRAAQHALWNCCDGSSFKRCAHTIKKHRRSSRLDRAVFRRSFRLNPEAKEGVWLEQKHEKRHNRSRV